MTGTTRAIPCGKQSHSMRFFGAPPQAVQEPAATISSNGAGPRPAEMCLPFTRNTAERVRSPHRRLR